MMPSVTAVLSTVWPKPALFNWYAKRGREAMAEHLSGHVGDILTDDMLSSGVEQARIKPQAEADEAADLGAQANDSVSRQLKGESVDVPMSLKTVMMAFNSWMAEQKVVLIDSEVAIYHRTPMYPPYVTQGYAGTIDALFRRADGTMLLVDFKTSKGVYPDHLVQLEAYRQAILWMSGLPQMQQGKLDAQIIKLGKQQPTFEVADVPNSAESRDKWWKSFEFYLAYMAKEKADDMSA